MSAVLQSDPVIYAGVRAGPVRIAPFDPNGVQPVTVDIQDWLGADTFVNHAWATNDPRILIGDGITTKLIGTGAIKVPIAPTPFIDPATGRQRIRAYYFVDDQAALEDGDIGADFEITVSLEAVFFGDDRTLLSELVEK